MPQVGVISPPFFSHARTLAVLGHALQKAGVDTTFACAPEFEPLAQRFRLAFHPLESTTGRNTGVARNTVQAREDRKRLSDFLEATRAGTVPALLVQSRDRRSDMLMRPADTLRQVHDLDSRLRADWYVVDQLNYTATLAMYCLRLRFATYVPGHPSYIPGSRQLFGVPDRWPDELLPGHDDLAALRATAADVEREFTATFNRIIAAADPALPPISRAFAFASPYARVFTYPQPPDDCSVDERSVYLGHCSASGPLPKDWDDRLGRLSGHPRVLVSLGTFMSARDDVLRTVSRGVRRALPGSALIVAAGDSVNRLRDLSSESVLVEEFIPQQELLPHVDIAVHHGGNNSFTECVSAGVPALILPFACDQIRIAHDAVAMGVARCLDPNAAGAAEIALAIELLAGQDLPALKELSRRARDRGPEWGASRLAELMQRRPTQVYAS